MTSQLIQQMQSTGRRTFRQPPESVDTSGLKARALEIKALMAELVEDRAAGLIDRAALLAGTAALRQELADIREALAAVGGHGAATVIDIKAVSEEFERLSLGEQRAVLREAFDLIRVIPRGKGRPKAGEPVRRPELIEVGFTPAWR